MSGGARDLGAETYPLMRVLGYRIAEWSAGYARVEMPIDPEIHVNRHGIPHGGNYATMLDTACAYAGTWRAEGEPAVFAMTLSLNLSFVGLPRGERLIAEARNTGGGRNTFFANGELRDELGTLVATAAAVLRLRVAGGDPTRKKADA